MMTLPPDWDGYPDHDHGAGTEEAGQEEVYVPLAGWATLVALGGLVGAHAPSPWTELGGPWPVPA